MTHTPSFINGEREFKSEDYAKSLIVKAENGWHLNEQATL